MAIIKCKMCGGDIELAADKTFGTCEYCGSSMTFPKIDDDQRAAAFNRGNHFRRIGEFDKALAVYERIVREDDTDAEAHWCCALCRFGIEYVEDPATYEYLPTCHRVSFDSFLEDVDYLAAVEHSEGLTKRQYQRDGAKIAEVQRGILATSQNTDPFDVFICYKESDENKERTQDSLLAQEIYYQLTDQGYRVFFSRITLEDMAGKQYEPYIFAALNSAKVMVVVGTKPEYLNAVWVKNEWSRFLAMMKKDRQKLLLPCYRDMDPYDMPEQLAVLQSYDMSKIGFIQDLIRGIKKVLDAEKQPHVHALVGGSGGDNKIASLLDRGNMALEDGDWEKADSFFEDVLNNDSKNAQAYIGKTLVQEKCRTIDAFVRKRKELSQKARSEMLEPEFHREHVLAMIKKWTIPGFVEEEELRKLYDWDERYPSEVADRKQQYHAEEKYWAAHRQLSRAEKFAVGAVAQNLAAEKKALFDVLSDRIKKAEEAELAGKKALQERYTHHLERADQEAEKRYNAGCDQREYCYQELIKIPESSFDVLKLKKAASKLEELGGYKDSKKFAAQCLEKCEKVYEMFAERRKVSAAAKNRISVSPNINRPLHIGIGTNGSVFLSGNDKYRDDAGMWTNVTAIAMGEFHALALDRCGKALCVGDNQYGQCNVEDWTNITAIDAGGWHSVGLRANGTVLAVGINKENECDVSSWRDIKKVCAGKRHTVGLKADGTVVATGLKDGGRCNVSKWTNVVDVFAFNGQTVGLRADGTVLVAGAKYRVDHWRDIVTVSMGYEHILGLKKDGTVVFAGKSNADEHLVEKWSDIVDISAKNCHCVGLRADGTVVASGLNESGQCDVYDWKDIIAVSAGDFCTLGVRADGTIRRVGDCNRQPYTQTQNWKLFGNIDSLDTEMEQAEKKWQMQIERQAQGRCRHCGGELKGLFSKKCVSCGRPKDY